MRLLLIFNTLLVLTSAQSPCDPQTQYLADSGQCCKKCGPGTSMSPNSDCHTPQCNPCGDNEYQDTFTTDTMCQQQPYCDPNRNFVGASDKSKTSKSPCWCKQGHYCNSEKCITCLPHTECTPGQRVKSKGNHSQDTVCENCPSGTFSIGTSEPNCKKWTICEPGHQVKTNGTATSDTVCESGSRQHLAWIVTILFIVILIGIGITVQKCKGTTGDAKGKVKGCVELCLEGTKEPAREAVPTVAQPTNDEHSLLSETGPLQEAKTPEEVEEPSEPLIVLDAALTDNGNLVAQEDGKKEVLSRQESQTQSCPSESV